MYLYQCRTTESRIRCQTDLERGRLGVANLNSDLNNHTVVAEGDETGGGQAVAEGDKTGGGQAEGASLVSPLSVQQESFLKPPARKKTKTSNMKTPPPSYMDPFNGSNDPQDEATTNLMNAASEALKSLTSGPPLVGQLFASPAAAVAVPPRAVPPQERLSTPEQKISKIKKKIKTRQDRIDQRFATITNKKAAGMDISVEQNEILEYEMQIKALEGELDKLESP